MLKMTFLGASWCHFALPLRVSGLFGLPLRVSGLFGLPLRVSSRVLWEGVWEAGIRSRVQGERLNILTGRLWDEIGVSSGTP